MDTTETTAALMGYVKQELMRGRNADLTEDTDLLGAGIINSLGVLQLVAFVDERLGVRFRTKTSPTRTFTACGRWPSYLTTQK